jgi:hypothetical protein
MGDPEYQKKYGFETAIIERVNKYSSLPASNEIVETGELVIATSTMSRGDWVRARVFSWIVDLFHFHKLLHVPTIIFRHTTNIGYGEIFEFFSEGKFNDFIPEKTFPILNEIRDFFFRKAREIQNGGVEYCYSEKWLKIYWPAEDYVFIDLIAGNKLGVFYEEAREAFGLLCHSRSIDLDEAVFSDAIELNRNLIKIPFQNRDIDLSTSCNVWEFYQAVLLSEPTPLVKQRGRYTIKRIEECWTSWEEWCQGAVWYQSNRRNYFYRDVSVSE